MHRRLAHNINEALIFFSYIYLLKCTSRFFLVLKNVRTTILDKIAVKDAMKRAEAAIKQQVYVIVGVILDGGCYTVNRVKHLVL